MKSKKLESQLQITIRQALPEDRVRVDTIIAAAYSKYIPVIGRKPQPMTVDYGQIIAEQSVWLLCLADLPVGVLDVRPETDHLLIYNVAIDPHYQGQGFGKKLLGWAEQVAQQSGYAVIRLYTNALMTANIALYHRLGYVETKREPYLNSTVVHMAKSISGRPT
jgi:ribosomal protein S18 acetylase RimI-like enzyme